MSEQEPPRGEVPEGAFGRQEAGDLAALSEGRLGESPAEAGSADETEDRGTS
ncbi:MAG: hypothetical protein ACR2HO_03760 [Rubrobacteraceae bacterium]|nr:hypothetical protein [Rubrobacter sp.]